MPTAVPRARERGDVTTISSRGQTVVPSHLRERLGLHRGAKLRWIEGAGSLIAIPVPPDPIAAVAGKYRGEGLLDRLLAARRHERDREARR